MSAETDVTYLVTLNTPKGVGTVEVTTFQGSEAAGRRALFSVVPRWGDLDEVTVAKVEEMTV
jgi:hypothetical protein